MDEVENPALPAAGEASPTLRPIEEDQDPGDVGSDQDPVDETVVVEGVLEDDNAMPLTPAIQSPTRAHELPSRPTLKRESSAPPPPQPPPAPPESTEFPQEPPDSLTLADLKRIRSSFPNVQTPQKQQLLDYGQVYDFDYQDAQSMPVEIEEWFGYSEAEQLRLRECYYAFVEAWKATQEGRPDWLDATEDVRRAFVMTNVGILKDESSGWQNVADALRALTYLGLGVWVETAGRQDGEALKDMFPGCDKGGSRLDEYESSGLQLQWIVAMVDMMHSCDALDAIFSTLRTIAKSDFDHAPPALETNPRNDYQVRRPDESIEMWCCLTLLYIFVEVARATQGENSQKLKKDIAALEPNLLTYLTQIVAMLRWEESLPVPLTKMLLLSWKTILVTIGGINDVENVKAFLRDEDNDVKSYDQPSITASPLDYHLFRQEISSKYPAYQPPPSLFPIEPENNSILPPLQHRRPDYASTAEKTFNSAPSVATGPSIMHQPVHIATPAPSPPPSPAGPGKAGKKQNYQTNQMFPFLYPPLDGSSNDLGGKGTTELQDLLVGRKWEGSDIPASIMEAAELFAKRIRATRAMKQLWEVRVDYMKQERGFKPDRETSERMEGLKKSLKVLQELRDMGLDVDDLDEELQDLEGSDDFEVIEKPGADETAEQGEPLDLPEEKRKLDAVANFYQDSLQHMQSVIIVLLKALLQNVTDMLTKGNGQNGLQAGIQFNDTNGINGSARPIENGTTPGDGIENTADELDKLRSQEIAGKALSAIILLLLKWFKASHILQYEYLTQLLVDSNYIPLVIKLWQTQEIGRACHYRLEKEELNFFHFCQVNIRHGSPKSKLEQKDIAVDDSEDEALPPPIKLKRDSPAEHPLSPTSSPPDFSHPPEVDELGYAQTPLPLSPIKSYSYRNVFTAINYLRILQKCTRRKTQRVLQLIHYKSSNHLKKSLKIPIDMLRLYSLKLYKGQVPFCGRKWRSGNMKIITAVWLSIPSELRDDWLSGGGGGMGGVCLGDLDGTVEDSIPLEQSLRSLTHWWNVRNFPQQMGWEKGVVGGEGEEGDFFGRELEMLRIVKEMKEEREKEERDQMEQLRQQQGGEWQGPIEGYQ